MKEGTKMALLMVAVIFLIVVVAVVMISVLIAPVGQYTAPECNSEAPPSIIVNWSSFDIQEVATKLAKAGWVSINTDTRGGIVTADCHKSKEWS